MMVKVTAGQATEAWFNGLVEAIKNKQLKTERDVIKKKF